MMKKTLEKITWLMITFFVLGSISTELVLAAETPTKIEPQVISVKKCYKINEFMVWVKYIGKTDTCGFQNLKIQATEEKQDDCANVKNWGVDVDDATIRVTDEKRSQDLTSVILSNDTCYGTWWNGGEKCIYIYCCGRWWAIGCK